MNDLQTKQTAPSIGGFFAGLLATQFLAPIAPAVADWSTGIPSEVRIFGWSIGGTHGDLPSIFEEGSTFQGEINERAALVRFGEVLAKAVQVFGSDEAARAWLVHPAMGLNRQRPIDLLETSAGAELVEAFLGRLEYDVYT
jgi:hypothetical protein